LDREKGGELNLEKEVLAIYLVKGPTKLLGGNRQEGILGKKVG